MCLLNLAIYLKDKSPQQKISYCRHETYPPYTHSINLSPYCVPEPSTYWVFPAVHFFPVYKYEHISSSQHFYQEDICDG